MFGFFNRPSRETILRWEKEEIIKANIKFYDEVFDNMTNLLNETWYVHGVKMLHGGKIYAANKKYPNVWVYIDLSYYEYEDHRDRKFTITPEFYIDENHWSKVEFGLWLLTSDDEDTRKEALKNLNTLVEMNVLDYCKDNKIKLEDNKFHFSFTDNETNEWMIGCLSPNQIGNMRNAFAYAYTITTKEYVHGCIANENLTYSRTKMTYINLDDKQKRIVSLIINQ